MLGKVAGGLLVGFVLYYLISNSYWQGYGNGYRDGHNDCGDLASIKVGGTD